MIYNQSDIDNYNKLCAKRERANSAHWAIGVLIALMAFSSLAVGLSSFAKAMGV